MKILLLTRLGIGVFDQKWWTARLKLFSAVTWPSLSRFFEQFEMRWSFILDSDIPDEAYDVLRKLSDGVSQGQVDFRFVDHNGYTKDAQISAIKAYAGPDERVLVLPIDDDDAVGADFFENVISHIGEENFTPAAISMSRGKALDAHKLRLADLTYISKTGSTALYMNLAELKKVLPMPHQKWLETSAKHGIRTVDDQDCVKQSVYTYHKQGDGSYDKRLAGVEGWRDINLDDARWFGIDVEALKEWVEEADAIPPTIGLTWFRIQPEMVKAQALKKQLSSIKKAIVATNSDIFNPATPFLYVLYPGRGSSRAAGRVVFSGAATPDRIVRLSVWSNKGRFVEIARSKSRRNGEFSLSANFNPHRWKIQIDLMDAAGEAPVKTLDWELNVRA